MTLNERIIGFFGLILILAFILIYYGFEQDNQVMIIIGAMMLPNGLYYIIKYGNERYPS